MQSDVQSRFCALWPQAAFNHDYPVALHGAGRTADEADDIVGSAALRTAARPARGQGQFDDPNTATVSICIKKPLSHSFSKATQTTLTCANVRNNVSASRPTTTPSLSLGHRDL